MKRIIISIATLLLVATVAIGATLAFFADPEVSTGSTFAMGKLDLELGAGNPVPFNLSNVAPGDNGSGKVTLTNVAGSMNGELDVKLANLVQSENGLVEPEIGAGDYENGGDLWISLEIAMFVDVNKDGVFNAGDYQLAYNGQDTAYPGYRGGELYYSSPTNMVTGWDDIMTMTDEQSVDVVIAWRVPTTWTYPNYNQNIIMTDTLGFDVQTSLEQVGGTGGVAN